MSAQVRLDLRPAGRGRIEVDGHDLSSAVAAVDVHVSATDRGTPHVALRLVVHETVIDGRATVGIPERTEKALIALGWTPPAPDEPAPSPALQYSVRVLVQVDGNVPFPAGEITSSAPEGIDANALGSLLDEVGADAAEVFGHALAGCVDGMCSDAHSGRTRENGGLEPPP